MIPVAEFARRRRELMQLAESDSIIIVPAANETLRNGDSHHPFRQDSDFLYLSGYREPDAVLVLVPGRDGGEALMFCRERDPERERWDGARLGLDGVRETLGFDDAFPIADLDEILPGLMENRAHIYHSIGRDAQFDQRVIGWRNRLREQRRNARGPEEFIALNHLLGEMRLFKSSAELKCMRRAARISATAHKRAMRAARPEGGEAELMAELMHEFLRHGYPPAYTPIVAGGHNALVLHYINNDQPLPESGLVLIDAGCEVEGYAADITRTFPVNGRFQPAERTIHELVRTAQLAAIDAVRPGRSFHAVHEAALRVLAEGLVELGLIDGPLDDALAEERYKRFFMHKTGHWLGLDVHDVGEYRIDGEWRLLEPNMVLTVEPGLYIGQDDDIPTEFRGIGVRIEDDVRVTRDEPEVLSGSAPAGADEIEQWMRG
ncbi:MAG: aminopeptidase P N-terminal domain-containing protein [Wenzhouxiangellaceae bacterium]|nr:aminopeptidase P N-terminal domain-containing protein [Wenzhouxiangellaceae bacterium]